MQLDVVKPKENKLTDVCVCVCVRVQPFFVTQFTCSSASFIFRPFANTTIKVRHGRLIENKFAEIESHRTRKKH